MVPRTDSEDFNIKLLSLESKWKSLCRDSSRGFNKRGQNCFDPVSSSQLVKEHTLLDCSIKMTSSQCITWKKTETVFSEVVCTGNKLLATNSHQTGGRRNKDYIWSWLINSCRPI